MSPKSIAYAIEVLGPIVFLGFIFTLNLTKTGIGVVLAFWSGILLKQEAGVRRQDGSGVFRVGPINFTLKGSFATLMLLGGFGLMFSGGEGLRQDAKAAVAAAVEKAGDVPTEQELKNSEPQ